ncbi:MAG: hypothetical protein PHP92_04950 [Candidatus Nanoarchaeia archaeon]|nr:hypothetical protein [Candidatus Nanoarchaeia archaeon]
MEVKTIKKEEKEKVVNKVEHYYNYKGKLMVKISGNFMGGGFSLSQNKAKAVLDNLDEIKKFVSGQYDEKIKELKEDQILEI